MPNHYSTLIKLGTPIVVGQIGNLVLNFADTLMIGHHSTTELAAASFVNGILSYSFSSLSVSTSRSHLWPVHS